jgi:hypothetical protein
MAQVFNCLIYSRRTVPELRYWLRWVLVLAWNTLAVAQRVPQPRHTADTTGASCGNLEILAKLNTINIPTFALLIPPIAAQENIATKILPSLSAKSPLASPPDPPMSPSRAPPTGPFAATNGTTTFSAAASSTSPTTTIATTTTGGGGKVGPHPGHIASSSQYTSESTLRRAQRTHNSDPAREDTYRLQGVQLIDNVREHLQLPLRTFATACVYYHRFRLSFRDAEYNYQDAALASLFVACKVEDTIKKSRDILAAADNIKNPDKPATADDKVRLSSARVDHLRRGSRGEKPLLTPESL